jgi:FKBP-type peptidyl-prolyl cis-trans isomerase FkpA
MRSFHSLSTVLIPAAVVAALAACSSQNEQAAAQPALATEDDKALYALGGLMSQGLDGFQLTAAELETVKRGLTDGVLKQPLQVDIDEYRGKIAELHETRMAALSSKEAEAGKAFLEKAAAEAGAQKTASGLVYAVLTEGQGPSPKATDMVKVHYRGTLIDGTVFDSSLERGEPATFPLDRVIPCWTEGVQLMKVGGKSRLICPAEIAYGERGSPPTIRPGATLVFEVELLDIVK